MFEAAHNLCFGAKIRQIDIPLHTQVLLYKSIIILLHKWVYIAWKCYPDDYLIQK